MKTLPQLMVLFGLLLLTQGCMTGPKLPNANINAYEAQARLAIASMPVMPSADGVPLPQTHPWYSPVKAQNLRIARAKNNFTAWFQRFDDRDCISFSFADPLELLPERSVAIDLANGDLVTCDYPTYGGTIGKLRFVWDAYPREKTTGSQNKSMQATPQ